MDFSKNFKKAREAANLTFGRLAELLHVPEETVRAWESGEASPKVEELNRLARALKSTVTRLLGQKEHKVEIEKDELFIDGAKAPNLNPQDVEDIVKYIDSIKSRRDLEAAHHVPPAHETGKKKILIIDDEQEMCELLYSYLAPYNYKVFLAFNGQMGLEYFDTIRPNLILLDLKMPDIDGSEVLKIIRKMSQVPVVIITGHPEDVSDIHLANVKIEGFISKPVHLQDVLNTVKYIIGE